MQLVWNNVVVMILALVVLIFLVTFFLIGSSGFMDFISSYFSNSNVDSVVQECNILVDTEQEYSYCCELRKVKVKGEDFSVSCYLLRDEDYINDRIKFLDCRSVEC